jgi:hypothetical protein
MAGMVSLVAARVLEPDVVAVSLSAWAGSESPATEPVGIVVGESLLFSNSADLLAAGVTAPSVGGISEEAGTATKGVVSAITGIVSAAGVTAARITAAAPLAMAPTPSTAGRKMAGRILG